MKKVLISCTYYFPNISGVSIYNQILAESMVNSFEVTVLTSQDKDRENVLHEVKMVRSPVLARFGKGVIMPWYIFDSMRLVHKSDVVNCHLPQLESVLLAFWAKIFGKKLIVTHHCEFGFDGPLSNKIIAILSFPFHFVTYMLANKIVAYTKDYAEHSMFLKIFKNKLVYILPPVVVGKENKKEIEILRKLFGEKKVIGYVGRIAWEKGLNYLIGAFKLIKEKTKAKLVLVGPYKDVVGDKSI